MSPIVELLDEVGLGGWIFLHRDQELRLSSALVQMAGLSAASLQGTLVAFAQHIHETDRLSFLHAIEHDLEGPSGLVSIVIRVTNSRIGDRWLSFRGRVIERDLHGKALRSQGVVIDLTAEKSLETSLQVEKQRFRNFIEFLPLPLCHTDAGEHMGYVNARFSATFGYTREDIPNLSTWWQTAFPDQNYRQFAMTQWREDVLSATENLLPVEPKPYHIVCKDGSVKEVVISGIALGSDFLTTFVDITTYHSERQILKFCNKLLGEISKNQPLKEVLQQLVDEMYKRFPELRLSIYLLDNETKQLHAVAGNTPRVYENQLEGNLSIGEHVGSCGAAAYLGKEIFTENIATHPNWVAFRELALSNGLKACWSTPLKTQTGQVLGTFAVYFDEPCQTVSDVLREWVSNLSAVALVAIEVNKRNEELATFSGTLIRAETIGQIGSWSFTVNSGVTVWSEQLFRILGFDPQLGQPDFADFMERVHPEDSYRLQGLFSQMVSGRETDEIAFYRYFLPSGEMRYFQPMVVSQRNANGQIYRYEGIVQDVTDSKQKELRLMAQLNELRRWQEVTLNRETRILELKGLVNQLLQQLGQAPRYEQEIPPKGNLRD